MPRRMLLLFGLLAPFGSAGALAAATDSSRFDGKWGVILVCPKAPDGALPFTFEFTAAVRQGTFHGEHGVAGRPGWLALDGRIQPDGTANLAARGLTGDPHYNINQTVQALQHQPDRAGGSLRTRCERPFRRLARCRQLAGVAEQRPNPHLRFHLYQAITGTGARLASRFLRSARAVPVFADPGG